MTTIKNSKHAVTLTPSHPNLTITGTLDAIGPAGTYAAYGFEPPVAKQGAVFAPLPTDATIRNTGTILSKGTTGTDFGIVLGGPGTITNTGLIKAPSGIFAEGPVTIKNAGTIKALTNAFLGTGIVMQGGGTLDNTATGLIQAGTIGVTDYAGTGRITNAGTIKARYDAIAISGDVDVANAGRLEGEVGVFASAAAHLTNTGTILVSTAGIWMDGGTVRNAGLISSSLSGVIDQSIDGWITNAASGTIIAKFDAISGGSVQNAGLLVGDRGITGSSVTNTGTIDATVTGIDASTYADNAGLISVTVTNGSGIQLALNGTAANTGTIFGYHVGILMDQYFTGTAANAPGIVTNAGLITASETAQTGFLGDTYLSAAIVGGGAATITNLATGTISDSAGIGISMYALYETFAATLVTYVPAAILNAGTITAEYGIQFTGPGTIDNTGTITALRDAVTTKSGPSNIYNSGLIATTGTIISAGGTSRRAEAIIMAQAGTLTNAATGTISAPYANSVVLQAGGAVYNQGYIAGVALYGPGYVRNAGVMTSSTAILISGGPGTVINTGTLVSTYFDGIDLAGGGMVTNTGTIKGGVSLGAAATIDNSGNITGAVAAALTSAVTITNTGTIGVKGRFGGVDINNGYVYNAGLIAGDGAMLGGFQDPDTVTLVNQGTIWSNDAAAEQNTGVYSRGAVIITNAGTIDGAVDGIDIQGSLNLTNTGTITGGIDGVFAQGGGTIYNAGLIKGMDTAEPAIDLAAGTGSESLLMIAPTSTIIGSAVVSGELSLAAGAGTISFAQFDNFGTLSLAAGADWHAGGTIIAKTTIHNGGGTLNVGGTGITLSRGGAVSNSGLIEGKGGLYIAASLYGITNNLDNTGLIASAVKLGGASKLTNAAHGTISAASAISLTGAGTVANQGLIAGAITGSVSGINIYNHAGARITATGDAISLGGRGIISITNAGYIHGAAVGIVLASSGHITDFGTIAGGAYAIKFTNGGSDYLALSPTAVTNGLVDIGGGQLTLMAGAHAGTLSSTQFEDITDLWVSPNADWTLTGDINAVHIENGGTILEAPGQPLTIGTFGGVVYGEGTIDITSVVNLQNVVTGGQHLAFTGTNQALQLQEPQNIAQSTIQNFAASDTIDMIGVTLSKIKNETFGNDALTFTQGGTFFEITFAADQALAADQLALTAIDGGTAITLTPPAMAFLTPAATQAASMSALTPSYAAAAPTPAYTTPSTAGWLPQTLLASGTSLTPLVTLGG